MPACATLVASAEALPLADGSVDAVICATAFHWFASARRARRIPPRAAPGRHARADLERARHQRGWVAALSELTNRYQGDAPRETEAAWRALFPAPGFAPLRETRMRYDHRGTPEDVIVGRTLIDQLHRRAARGDQGRAGRR